MSKNFKVSIRRIYAFQIQTTLRVEAPILSETSKKSESLHNIAAADMESKIKACTSRLDIAEVTIQVSNYLSSASIRKSWLFFRI